MLLSYRSFASIIGVVAALVSGIVLAAGVSGVVFLVAKGAPGRGLAALLLTALFAFFIARLVPRLNVTLYDENHPALTVSQRSVFPAATYIVTTPNGVTLAEVRKTFLSRLGRNRWTIEHDGRYVGEAVEDSFPGALRRKLLGKFSRRFETNVRLLYGGLETGRILRRPTPTGDVDLLELVNDALDRRVAVAVATLVLGREP